MINYRKETVEREIPDTITCDVCHITYEYDSEDYMTEIHEFNTIRFMGGYGSVFGDGTEFECHICQHCLKKLLGDKLRIIN